jgi:hypothetical protein
MAGRVFSDQLSAKLLKADRLLLTADFGRLDRPANVRV